MPENDDAKQQVLPFDFMEDDDNEKPPAAKKKQEKKSPKTVKAAPSNPSAPSDKKTQQSKKSSQATTSSNLKPGQILQEARVRMDLSIDQVVQNTKIKKNFIEALENGDKANLPAAVYVNAYIKKLCKLYEIDPEQVMHKTIKEPEQIIPENFLHSIEEGKQINLEEEAKINKFLKIAVVVIFAIGLITWIAVRNFSDGKESNTNNAKTVPARPSHQNIEQPVVKITSKDLEIFIAPRRFTMTEMSIPIKK